MFAEPALSAVPGEWRQIRACRKSGDGSTAPSEGLDGRPPRQVGAVSKPIDHSNVANSAEGKILIGTSGWHYKHWLGKFYPRQLSSGEMLSFYSREFPTVEINNSFYRLPDEGTFRKWKSQAPAGFVFAVKASRYITHIKRLREPKASVDLLLERASPLGASLGPILFQLPPRWKADIDRLSAFLEVIPSGYRIAVEFRDRTWCREDIYALLRAHNVAMCFHDWGGFGWPEEVTSNFAYIRFHGAGQRYGGDYPEKTLVQWTNKIRTWSPDLERIYVYFNNDAHGYAIRNARSLRQMLGLRHLHDQSLVA